VNARHHVSQLAKQVAQLQTRNARINNVTVEGAESFSAPLFWERKKCRTDKLNHSCDKVFFVRHFG